MAAVHQILLWVGPLYKFVQENPTGDCELIQVNSVEDAAHFLGNLQIAVVVAALPDVEQSLRILEEWEQTTPLCSRVLICEEITEGILRQSVNQAHIHQLLSIKDLEKKWQVSFHKALDIYRKGAAKASLLKESTRQLRELEALNQSLEKIVSERTQHIETSKLEEEERLNQVRGLTRFIKDLSQVSSFEDLLLHLRRELRRFHKVGDPVFVYQTSAQQVDYVSIQSGQAHVTVGQELFPFLMMTEKNHKGASQVLANQFARPFAKTLYVPLDARNQPEGALMPTRAAVCIEYSVREDELEDVLTFFQERRETIALTVDRILLENEMTQFSYRWERTFDGLRDPIAIIDVDFEVLRANRKFMDKWTRKKCYESFAGRTEPCEGCPLTEALSSGKPTVSQVKRGNQVFDVHSYPITLQGAGSTNVVHQYVDVTQSRELYLRMLQSEKMGAMGLLAGNIAHELNNPLTGLRSLAQVLRTQVPPNSSMSDDFLEIEKAAARSQLIIKNLLEFSQGLDQNRKRISLDEIVEKTMPMLKAVMRLHRQEITLETRDFLVDVEPHLIQQVVFNLITNACQAMKDAGTLTVETSLDPETENVVLEVRDTGQGIPDSLKEKVFEPFFTTKKEGLGTGLGLSLSRKIIESHGGQIRIQSSPGQGASFLVILPWAKS